MYWLTKSKVKEFAEEERNKSKREHESEERGARKIQARTSVYYYDWINANLNAVVKIDDKSTKG